MFFIFYLIRYICVCVCVTFLTSELPCYVAASTLKFDDIEKQKKYKEISFEEVHNEVVELKVFSLSKYVFACNLHSVATFHL